MRYKRKKTKKEENAKERIKKETGRKKEES